MTVIRLVPCTLKMAKRTVGDWHSHHKPPVGHMWSTGAEVDDEFAGVVIVSMPIAEANRDGFTMEVTRLCCRGVEERPEFKNVASRLLGSACASAENRGVRLMLSYTRVDEPGTCYRAAGWVPCGEIIKARDWTSGNKRTRWLPGFYEPTTERIDRVRWEWRPPQAVRAVAKMIYALGEWSKATQRQQRRAA